MRKECRQAGAGGTVSLRRDVSVLKSERGIALLMVLWVLVLLSVIALNHLKSTRWYAAGTRNLKEETASYYLALSGYHQAIQYLVSDKDQSLDYSDGDGNFWVDRENPTVTGKTTNGEEEVEIGITDEDSMINVNYASPERLRQLFAYIGLKDDEINEVLDSVLDWKDSGDNDAHRLSGAESDYYEGLERPYTAKNGAIDVPEELLLIKGMKPEYLYGGGEVRGLGGLITTYGKGAININTVSPDVMAMIGMNEYEVEAIMKQRSGEAGGFTFVPGEFSRYGLNTTTSSILRIEVKARVSKDTPAARIVAVVNRQPGMKGYKVQTLYWRESAETAGS